MNQSIANLIYIILFLFAVGQTEAQPPDIAKPFRVGAGLGCSFTGYREETEAPINRYLNALTFIVDGNIEKGRFFHSFNISFFNGSAEMTIPYEGYSQKRYNASSGLMEYALDYRLWGNQTFPGYLGGAFRTAFYFTTVDDAKNTHTPTGYGLVSLDAHATQKWIVNAKNTLTLSAGFPVFGYAVRPPYAMSDELWIKYSYEKNYIKFITLGKVVSFHNYWAFFGDLKYQYKVNTWLSLYSELNIGLSCVNFHRPRTDAVCRLNAGIAFTF